MLAPDGRVPGAGRLYCDMLLETILKQRQKAVEEIVESEVWPSYTYLRLHSNGASMARHIDRPASEIGVTIAIGGDQKWPIWFRTKTGDISVSLDPGDAVIYLGGELPHWREKYEGQTQIQAILFYVFKNGAHADSRFDGRSGVGVQPRRNLRVEMYQRLRKMGGKVFAGAGGGFTARSGADVIRPDTGTRSPFAYMH